MDEMRNERFAQMTSAEAASEKTSGFVSTQREAASDGDDDDDAGEGDNNGGLACSPRTPSQAPVSSEDI
jgi:hypothetical protein